MEIKSLLLFTRMDRVLLFNDSKYLESLFGDTRMDQPHCNSTHIGQERTFLSP